MLHSHDFVHYLQVWFNVTVLRAQVELWAAAATVVAT